MDANVRDLSLSYFQFECIKKAKQGEKKFKGYLLPKFMFLMKEGQTKPKYELPIELSTHIKWEVAEEMHASKKVYKCVSFKFQQVKLVQGKHVAKIVQFSGKEDQLLQLKEKLRNKIIYQRIQDFFTPLQTLGKGSSSRVLLVRNKTTEQFFAAKCVDKQYVNESENGIESMFLEIEIQNILDHPSFIKLYEVYEGDNTFYMVMDLLEGKSLHDELNSHKNGFPIEICKTVMTVLLFSQHHIYQQIISGIAFMHSKNIMHRDIKPENIMLQKKGDLNSLKIVDFGLATYCDVEKFLFPKCGTPGYVAPEIANLVDKTVKYDKVCDVFSVGVIFFKLLTGKDLFPGTGFNLVLKLNKQCKIDLTPLSMKKIPQPIINLIAKMLEKDPKQRPDAKDILLDPFFSSTDIKNDMNPSAKKAFFQNIKEQNQKIAQTTDFAGVESSVPNDEQIHHKPGQSNNPFNTALGANKKKEEDNNVGSLIMKDGAFKGLNTQTKKPMAKFNTSEFAGVDLSKPQPKKKQLDEPIDEEEEHKQ